MYKIIVVLSVIISFTRGEDYYEILNVSRSADQDEIRRAFKKLAIIRHPDKNINDPNAHDKFVKLTKAYEILKDTDLRRKYDLSGEDGLNNYHGKQTYHSWGYYHNNFGLYDDDKYVINLKENDYYGSVINSDLNWFVNFYSMRCGACHQLAPTWMEVAKLLNGIVKIAAVNCVLDKRLCYEVGIRAYPTLLYFQKNSQYGVQYKGELRQEAITRFAIDRLNIHVPEISESQWKVFIRGKNIIQRPMLIFICDDQQNCFTPDERIKVAATFDKVINVKVFTCQNDKISYNTHVVYLPMHNASSWEPIFLDNIYDINTLIEKLIDLLPGPQELSDSDFEHIREMKSLASNVAWLICFYIGDALTSNLRDLNLEMKKFSISHINLGKINCGRNGRLCSKLGINRYPMWGMLKPGGAFELNHRADTNSDIIKFVQISVKTTNVWSLSAEEVLSILQRNNGDEVWFLDWFTPWCPPCMEFLSELRRASLEFDASIIRFGTIDCTVHSTLCRQYNIQYYPTVMLINGSNTYQFTLPKTAENVVQFINEKRNPSVIELTTKNFHKLRNKKNKDIWIVDYFVPWCGACKKLAPIWIAVAKSLSALPFVNVASVNCEVETSLCKSQGVRSYPDIRMYPLGSEGLNTVAFYGPRNGIGHINIDMVSVLTWITSFFPKKIHDLNFSDCQKLLDNKHMWIVFFYSPYCQHCQKMELELEIAAQLLQKVKFGKIDCSPYMHECKQHIKQSKQQSMYTEYFPTLILYNSKQKKNKHEGVEIVAKTAKAIRDEILEIINTRTKSFHDEL